MIRYHPLDLLRKIAPDRKIEKLMKGNLTPNKAALSFLTDVPFLDGKAITRVALNTINQYQDKYGELQDQGLSNQDAKDEAVNGKALLIDRVQNTIVNQVANEIEDNYRGEFYKWLPSDALNPDPLHQLKYGKKFQLGKGEKPGDRYGCRCGMQILVKETKLNI